MTAPANPFTPGTQSHQLAALMLDDHAARRWRTTPALCALTGAKPALVNKVRERLQAEGLIGLKGDYSTARTTLRRRVRAAAALAALAALCVALAAPGARAQVLTWALHDGPRTAGQSLWYTDAIPGPCDDSLDGLLTVARGALVARCEGDGATHRMVYYAYGPARVVRWGWVTLEERAVLRLPLVVR